MKLHVLSIFFLMIIISLSSAYANSDSNEEYGFDDLEETKKNLPIIYDDDYDFEKIVDGLHFPTKMNFLNNDIIVLEHTTGKVILVKDNGVRLNQPILDLAISHGGDNGLTGIAVTGNLVFLYYFDAEIDQRGFNENTKDVVYQFSWDGSILSNPKLVKEFDGSHNRHHSGILALDSENNLYVIKGDGDKNGILQNFVDGEFFESGVFKIDTKNLSSKLYGMGIRNSFGLAIDPLTEKLWQTENSIAKYDEINLVENGFNGGWKSIVGPSYRFDAEPTNQIKNLIANPYSNFTYYDPKFSWYDSVAPTEIIFPNTVSFGNYKDHLFVGDCKNGNVYNFKLNAERNGFVFNDYNLSKDLVLDINDDDKEIVFANFPGRCITDIDFRSDGMYLLSYFDGSIYRIFPKEPLSPAEQYMLGSTNNEIFCKNGLMKITNEYDKIECISFKSILNKIDTKIFDKNNSIKLNAKNENLEQYEFKNLNFSQSNFQNAKFGKKIISVDFSNTNLSNSDLSNTDLSGTILTGADLSGAILTNVDLSNTDLSGTILTGADLSDVEFNPETTNQIIDSEFKEFSYDFYNKLENFTTSLYHYLIRNFDGFLNQLFS